MKVEVKKTFRPVIITFENKSELITLVWALKKIKFGDCPDFPLESMISKLENLAKEENNFMTQNKTKQKTVKR